MDARTATAIAETEMERACDTARTICTLLLRGLEEEQLHVLERFNLISLAVDGLAKAATTCAMVVRGLEGPDTMGTKQ